MQPTNSIQQYIIDKLMDLTKGNFILHFKHNDSESNFNYYVSSAYKFNMYIDKAGRAISECNPNEI